LTQYKLKQVIMSLWDNQVVLVFLGIIAFYLPVYIGSSGANERVHINFCPKKIRTDFVRISFPGKLIYY